MIASDGENGGAARGRAKVRVLIADDFALVRAGIATALRLHPAIEVVGEAEDGVQALERARELRPDVIVLDLRMADHGGMEALDDLRTRLPEIKVLVLTANQNPDNVRSAIAAGASGYLTKHADDTALCEAVLAVERGALVLAPSLAGDRRALSAPAGGPALTSRQRAIVRLVGAGLTDEEIAGRVFVSARTVQQEIREVKRAAGITRRSELARWAVIHSLA